MDNDPYGVADMIECEEEAPNHSTQSDVEQINVIGCNNIPQSPMEAEENKTAKRKAPINSSEEEEEHWNTVSKRNKFVRRLSQEEKVQVSVTSTNAPLPKQFALARLFKENNIKGIGRVRYVHQYKMLILFDRDIDACEFINNKSFFNMGWRSQKTSEVGLSYGVIKNIEIDVSDEEILKNLSSDHEIVSAKRLDMRNTDDLLSKDGSKNWIQSESIRLAFRGSSLPGFVFIDSYRIKVEPYIFPVTQCSRCWKFGHTWKMCPSKKVVCPKCSKNHENCDVTSFRCVNCTENHMALQKICPIYKKERRIRELMAEFNCTYRKALLSYVPPSPITIPDSPIFDMPNKQPVQTNHELSSECDPLPTKRLMSQLFTNPTEEEQESVKTPFKAAQERKKKKKQRPPTPGFGLSPSTAPAPTSAPTSSTARATVERMETDWNDNTPQSERSENNPRSADEIPRSSSTADNNKPGELSWIRLLIRLKNISTSEESLEVKIKQVVSICVDWIISKLVSTISVGSLFESLINYG